MNTSMAFSDYMQTRLYDKNTGYYLQTDNPIGTNGDFITAPEISPALAYACAESFIKLAINKSVLCEVGPGSGKLTYEILLELNRRKQLPEKVWLIELNSARELEQRKLFSCLPNNIYEICEWYQDMPKTKWHGMLVANEILDAQPFDLIFKDVGKWFELRVKHQQLISAPMRAELEQFLPKTCLPDGYRTEICVGMPKLLENLTENLQQGALLFIDYGYNHNEYYHPQRLAGTSKVFAEHVASNDLLLAENCDITAHVDFSLVSSCLIKLGFDISAFLTQAQFLVKTNSFNYLTNLDNKDYHNACQAFKSLIFDMGDVFKVLMLEKNSQVWHDWLYGFGKNRL